MKTLSLALFSALAVVPAHATLHGFDIPGGGHEDGHGTYVNAINAEGDVTGNVIADSGQSSGFVRNANATFTVFNGAANADTHGIGMEGSTITGYYTGSDGHNRGYYRVLDGTLVFFDPKHSQDTQSIAINQARETAGQYSDSKKGGLQRGFIYKRNKSFEVFDGGADAQTFGTFVTAMNTAKTVCGFWFDNASAMHGFVRTRDGTIAQVDIAGAGTGALQGTQVESINPHGDVAGFYTDAGNQRHGFLRLADGTVTTFDAPGAANTVVAGINSNRLVAGYYVDASGVAHGFVRLRHGHFKTFDAPGAALEGGRGTFVSDINDAGAVSGEVYDHQFGAHGFAGVP